MFWFSAMERNDRAIMQFDDHRFDSHADRRVAKLIFENNLEDRKYVELTPFEM